MKLTNNRYNKIKLLTILSCIIHFIDTYALADARDEQDSATSSLLEQLRKDIEQYIEKLNKEISNK